MSVIKIQHLTKDYGNHKGLFDLSFEVSKGEVFGYLGPNGAGKTTTIRHLLGFLSPDNGTCEINGLNCRTQAATIQKELGYLPGEIAFFDDMTGMQFLKFMAQMRGMKDFSKAQRLIEQFELDTKVRIKKMSKGMKQKVGIICAFMHDPQVLILDEPTSGLDPLMQNKFVELILEEKQRGKTIIMSSHSFEEVERTCDRVGIIKSGELVTIESVSTLKASQRKVYVLTFESEAAASQFANEPVEVVSVKQNEVHVSVNGSLPEFLK
ncbi:MAG TPA: ABC transporter ATP-binding protein, partial [Firmicutes bacterium]|nr:ABC transporter ATP-binding protein [Bacillota bacterium]